MPCCLLGTWARMPSCPVPPAHALLPKEPICLDRSAPSSRVSGHAALVRSSLASGFPGTHIFFLAASFLWKAEPRRLPQEIMPLARKQNGFPFLVLVVCSAEIPLSSKSHKKSGDRQTDRRSPPLAHDGALLPAVRQQQTHTLTAGFSPRSSFPVIAHMATGFSPLSARPGRNRSHQDPAGESTVSIRNVDLLSPGLVPFMADSFV